MKKLFTTILLVCFVVFAYCADINPSPNKYLSVGDESTLRLYSDLTLSGINMTYWENQGANFNIVSADGNPHTLYVTGNVSINGLFCLVLGAGITLNVAGDISIATQEYLHIETAYGSTIIANNVRGGSGPIRVNGALQVRNELQLQGGNNLNLYLGEQSSFEANSVTLATAGVYAGNGFTCNSLTISSGNVSQLYVSPESRAVVNGPIKLLDGTLTVQGDLVGQTLEMQSQTYFNADANSTVAFAGDVSISSGSLNMGNNAQFSVGGDCKFENVRNVNIASGANLKVEGDVYFSSGQYDIDGNLSVGDDLLIGWTNTVSGEGSMQVVSNLYCGGSNTTTGQECLDRLAAGGFNIGHLNSTPLPVELLSFSAISAKNKAVLQWQTATETNNDYYTIYRSTDCVNFQKIAIFDGAGNSNSVMSYKYADFDAPQGTVYYRLEQTDYDGTTVASKIVSVNHISISADQVCLYPNPLLANQTIMLNVGAEVFSPVKVTIQNIAGVQVAQWHINDVSGDVSLDANLSPGLYVATISILNNTVKVVKLVVK